MITERSVADLCRVVRAGGTAEVDGEKYQVADLCQIGRSGTDSGGGIVVHNSDRFSASDLVTIGRAGKGRVTFK